MKSPDLSFIRCLETLSPLPNEPFPSDYARLVSAASRQNRMNDLPQPPVQRKSAARVTDAGASEVLPL